MNLAYFTLTPNRVDRVSHVVAFQKKSRSWTSTRAAWRIWVKFAMKRFAVQALPSLSCNLWSFRSVQGSPGDGSIGQFRPQEIQEVLCCSVKSCEKAFSTEVHLSLSQVNNSQ